MAQASERLASVSATPRLDAEVLLAHVIGVDRAALFSKAHRVPTAFEQVVEQRLRHAPIAYITGTRGFWTLDIAVTRDVLIPRPDSETLIDAAIANFQHGTPRRVLDLGTGSGALLLAALDQWRDARGVGIDASPAAVAVARGNAVRLGFGDRAVLIEGDWSGTGERFDLILCNPPYVATDAVLPRDVAEWEPASALFAGADGLDAYRRVAPLLGEQLAPGGVACIEIGHDQRAAASALFIAEKLHVAYRADLGGRDRCLIITK